MGWFGDALKVLLGLDDEQRAWRDRISAAEHHLRWGIESRQQRDFERVLDILAQCPDGERVSAHYLYRRERAAAEAHLWLGRLALERLSGQLAKVVEYFEAVEEGRRSLSAQVDGARERVKRLETDGSLISAREERRRLEDMEREAHELPDLSSEKRERRTAVFAKIGPVFEAHRGKAAACLAALRAVAGLAPDDQSARDEVVKQQDAGLTALEAEWKALNAAAAPVVPAAQPVQGAKSGAAGGKGGAEKNAAKPAG